MQGSEDVIQQIHLKLMLSPVVRGHAVLLGHSFRWKPAPSIGFPGLFGKAWGKGHWLPALGLCL